MTTYVSFVENKILITVAVVRNSFVYNTLNWINSTMIKFLHLKANIFYRKYILFIKLINTF